MTRRARVIRSILGVLALAAQMTAFPAVPAEYPQVAGWTIARGDQPMICMASGPTDGGARLSLAAEGPQFLLMVEGPDLPTGKGSYQVELSFDGKTAVFAPALGENGLISIGAGRGDLAKAVVSSTSLRVTVNGRVHRFVLGLAGAALDAVARCAGQQTLSEQIDQPASPIQGAGGWRLAVTLPGVAGRVCEVRNAGDEVDTILILNDRGELLLIGGHRDWATWGGDAPLKLSIDGGPPLAMKASTVTNLIMTLVTDPDLVRRLRAARTLDWTLPTGHVRGDVTGLGAAMDAMAACKSDMRSGSPAGY